MPNKRYPPDAAGSRLVTAFPRVKIGEKIKDVENMLLDKADAFDTIDYVYVVDNDDVLKVQFPSKSSMLPARMLMLKKSWKRS